MRYGAPRPSPYARDHYQRGGPPSGYTGSSGSRGPPPQGASRRTTYYDDYDNFRR